MLSLLFSFSFFLLFPLCVCVYVCVCVDMATREASVASTYYHTSQDLPP